MSPVKDKDKAPVASGKIRRVGEEDEQPPQSRSRLGEYCKQLCVKVLQLCRCASVISCADVQM